MDARASSSSSSAPGRGRLRTPVDGKCPAAGRADHPTDIVFDSDGRLVIWPGTTRSQAPRSQHWAGRRIMRGTGNRKFEGEGMVAATAPGRSGVLRSALERRLRRGRKPFHLGPGQSGDSSHRCGRRHRESGGGQLPGRRLRLQRGSRLLRRDGPATLGGSRTISDRAPILRARSPDRGTQPVHRRHRQQRRAQGRCRLRRRIERATTKKRSSRRLRDENARIQRGRRSGDHGRAFFADGRRHRGGRNVVHRGSLEQLRSPVAPTARSTAAGQCGSVGNAGRQTSATDPVFERRTA